MDKKYLAQIIATDNEGLQMISACTAGAKVKVADIKYLASNKVFLLSIERTKIETDQEDKKVNSICRFDFVDKVKSKNIDQKNDDLALDLIAIDYLKNKDDYEINLIFDNNVLADGIELFGYEKGGQDVLFVINISKMIFQDNGGQTFYSQPTSLKVMQGATIINEKTFDLQLLNGQTVKCKQLSTRHLKELIKTMEATTKDRLKRSHKK